MRIPLPEEPQLLAGSSNAGQSLASPRPTRQTESRGAELQPSSASLVAIWAAAGSGLFVGLLLVGCVGWMVLSGQRVEEVAIADPASQEAEHAPVVTHPTEEQRPTEPRPAEPAIPAASEVERANPKAETPGLEFVSLKPSESPLGFVKTESDERLEVFKLPGKTWAADYDRESGRLAVTNDDVGILVYDIDETAKGRPGPVGALPTEGLPTAVCFKRTSQRRFLVTAGNKRPKAELFDADSLEKTGEVQAPDAKFLDYLGGNPSPDDPYVYYSTSRNDQDVSRQFKAEQLGRININSMEAETINVVAGQPGRQSAVEATAILFSDQGEMLYLRDSHGGTKCVTIEGSSEGTDAPVIWGGGPASPTCAVGANDQLVAAGRFVLGRYFCVSLGRAEFDVEAFFPSRPLMVGFTANSLAFGSTNDFKTVARVPLPSLCIKSKGADRPFRMLPRERPEFEATFLRVFVDEGRDLVIGVLPEHLLAAPLSRLNLPVQKSITVIKRLPMKVYVNAEVTLELETEAEDVTFEVGKGRDASGKVRFERAVGADGFEENLPIISGRTLSWTPSSDQVGARWIHLRTRQGELTRDWIWSVVVEQRKTDLPFYVAGVNIDATGRLAAVWGRSTASASDKKYLLGVLDVERRELIQETEVPECVQSATIDPSGIYVSFDSKLTRLDRETLEVQSQTDLDFAAELQIVGGKYLAATGRRGNFQRFTVPDLTPVEPAVNSYEYIPLGGRLDDQWMWDGVLWDAEMRTPELLAFPAHFGVPPNGTERGVNGGASGTFAYQTPGRYTGPFNAKRPTYGTGCTPPGYPGFLYVQYRRLNVHKSIRHLNGERPEDPVKSVQLSTGASEAEDSGYMSCGRDVVAIAYGGQLSWIAMDEILPKQDAFAIAHRQSTIVLDPDATTVHYEAKDGAKFTLLLWTRRPDPHFYDEPQLKAESTDGSFTLSLEPVKLVADAVFAVQRAQFPREKSGNLLDDYLDAVTPAFEQIVGRKPTGVPFPAYAVVTAESSYRETDYLVHFYLVEAPRTSVEEGLK